MGRSTVLVTGASGFIGGHLVERLLAQGANVRCVVRPGGGRAPAGAEPVRADYLSGEGLAEAVAGVDVVYHLAGVTKALRLADYHAGNVVAAGNIARVADVAGRFIHVSSIAAAGPSPAEKDVDEGSEPKPVSEYGRSKLEGELVVRKRLPDAVVVRPPVVYGPRDTDVFEMLRAVARGFDLRIGGGERWFTAIYVEDLVTGLIAAASSPSAAGRVYFLAHREAISWTRFTEVAAKLMDCRPRTVILPRGVAFAVGWGAEWIARLQGKPGIISRDKIREAAYSRWTCSTERARLELGFSATTGLEEGMAKSLAWYKEHQWI